MKSLREKVTRNITTKEAKDALKITYMVTGEYGEKNKRPHWHAILFNYSPKDSVHKYTTDQGEKVYTSSEIDSLWKKGNAEFGSVTLESAGYVARYAAKKLVHGNDNEHAFHPIHKVSSKRAIGRSWIEKYHKHTFENGFIVLPNGQQSKIPRYYVDWYKKYHFEKYLEFKFGVMQKIIEQSEKKARKEEAEYLTQCMNYKGGAAYPYTRSKVKETILKSKFKQLQEKLKL
jgi:phosphoribosyl-AMP cyclohydrolase